LLSEKLKFCTPAPSGTPRDLPHLAQDPGASSNPVRDRKNGRPSSDLSSGMGNPRDAANVAAEELVEVRWVGGLELLRLCGA
jgi:hypothetical protein